MPTQPLIYCGIDPGLSGAIAFLEEAGTIIDVVKMPVIRNGTKRQICVGSLLQLLEKFNPSHTAIEKVHAMPGQGVASMFTFGYCCGLLEGVLAARSLPYGHVTPQAWQKRLFEGVDAAMGKKRSAIVVAKRWPTWRSVTDGEADAMCIAEWLRREELGNAVG